MKDWGDLIVQDAKNIGRPANAALEHVRQLEEAGFEDIVQLPFKWPPIASPKIQR